MTGPRVTRAPRRISFTEYDAEHIYEWLAYYWRDQPPYGRCYECQQLGARLARFIGPREVRRIRRAITRGTDKPERPRRRAQTRILRRR